MIRSAISAVDQSFPCQWGSNPLNHVFELYISLICSAAPIPCHNFIAFCLTWKTHICLSYLSVDFIRLKLRTLWIFGKVQCINCDNGFLFLHVSNFIETDKSECLMILDWFAKNDWCVELRMGVEKRLFLNESCSKGTTSNVLVGKINFWVVVFIDRLFQRVIWV